MVSMLKNGDKIDETVRQLGASLDLSTTHASTYLHETMGPTSRSYLIQTYGDTSCIKNSMFAYKLVLSCDAGVAISRKRDRC